MIAWLAPQFVINWFAVAWNYVCPQKPLPKFLANLPNCKLSNFLHALKLSTRYCIMYSIPFSKIPDETTDRKHYDDSKE